MMAAKPSQKKMSAALPMVPRKVLTRTKQYRIGSTTLFRLEWCARSTESALCFVVPEASSCEIWVSCRNFASPQILAVVQRLVRIGLESEGNS